MSVSYIYQLETENKRLKDSIKLLSYDQIKHIKLIEGLAQNRNKLKEKLEKIKKVNEHQDGYLKIKEILKDNK